MTLLRQLHKGQSGQTLAITAVFLGVLAFGFAAMATDIGLLFQQKRRAQAAADAAAMAAASEVAAGYSANQQIAANAVAKLNGFDPAAATNPATVTLSTPSTGNFTGSNYVQAVVSKPIPTFFMEAFTRQPTTVVAASAIAGGSSSSPTCVCLTGTSGNTLNLSNNAKLNANGCGVVDNSISSNAITITGSASLSGLSLGTVSTNWNNAGNINNAGTISASVKIVTGISSSNACSPPMPTPPSFSSCLLDPGLLWGTYTFGPASASATICYFGLTVGANGSTVTLNPGTYVINGGVLHFSYGANNKSNLGGNGVFFYLTNGASVVIDNGANVNLVAGGGTTSTGGTAPTVGNYNGYVFYQASTDIMPVNLQGGTSTYINGSLYAPSAALTIGNGAGASITGGIVAASLTMNGGGTLNASATTNEGSLSSGSAKVVQ